MNSNPNIGLLSPEYDGPGEYTILTRRYTPSVPNFGVYDCTLPHCVKLTH